MKKKSILTTLIGLLLISTLVFQACKKENKDTSSSNDKVPETTKVIDNQIWQSNYTGMDSSTNTLSFNKNLTSKIPLKVGDIIVSSTGNGLLRKISKITEIEDRLEIETKFASLTEVINEGKASFNSILSTQKIMKVNYLKKGVELDTSMMKSDEDTQLNYDIDVYLDSEEKIHLQGNFSILTELSGQLEIGYIPPRISLFELTYEIDQSLDLSAYIELLNLNYEQEIDLASVYFQPIIVVISGVPIVLVPELEIAAGIETEVYCDLYTEIYQSMDYTIGLLYENNEWSTINEFNKSFSYSPPQLSCNANARAYIKPQFNILIYGVVSPYLYSDLYCRIDADLQSNPWWDLYAGANIGVGVEAEILGVEIFDFNTNPPLISFEDLIASASNSSDPPISDFSANVTSGTAPLVVNFTDQSINNPTSWQWNFGDGNTSTIENPAHTYSNSGSYTLTLTASNDFGSDTEVKTNYISVSESGSSPVADFSADNTTGITPLVVNFTDQSSNNPTSWQWDFGDGATSTQESPAHTFNNPGDYTVTLTATNSYGSDVETKANYIVVSGGGSTGTFTDPRDGQTYNTVEIGSQEWFAENLNYETSNSWWYDNSSANGDVYGRLYTWDAALTACPSGWHLPSDDEWKTLERYLGMSQSEADDIDGRGTDEGEKLKSTSGWSSDGNGTDAVGFTALPGGYRVLDGTFGNLGNYGIWWSASMGNEGSWYRFLIYNTDKVYRYSSDEGDDFSVRCLRD